MIPLWSGIANTWDCDEMGHMNVRVYVEKAMEGLGNFAGAIGISHAFKPGAPSTLQPVEHHIRYIREAHAGAPLVMTGCVLEWDETSALIYQDMRHGDGRPAAAFRTRVRHVDAERGLHRLRGEADLPADFFPTGLHLSPDQRRLNGIGVVHVHAGMTKREQADLLAGALGLEESIGRVFDIVFI